MNFIRISPENIHIRIHYHKIVENFDAFHLAGGLKYLPININVVWIQEAQGAMVALIFAPGKDFLKQNFITVALMYDHIFVPPGKLSELLRFAPIQIDEMEFAKWGGNQQCVEGASRDEFTSSL
jgi:hypothetical protein